CTFVIFTFRKFFRLIFDVLHVKLHTSFEGRQIYPENETKEQTFTDATENRQIRADIALIPEGVYYLKANRRGFGEVTAKMKVENGRLIVLKGSICAPILSSGLRVPESRRTAVIQNNILIEDKECNSPSEAGWIPLGKSNNGWKVWKTSSGKTIDSFRNNQT
ncbi:MAG: DUF4357 domain-containing protein, partial [Muribaculaceae bacterium]|nr:DUF4357 domain-containing protein [Muribaculaceae bacterium]